MSAPGQNSEPPNRLRELLEAQRAAQLAAPMAGVATRIDRLDRAIDLLVEHQQRICAAMAADFGQRPPALSRFMDIFPALHGLKFARQHVRGWMRPRRVRLGLPMGVPGTRGTIQWQPLGVVGVVSPWNFPIALTFGPLAGILAAGNRCLLKPSEFTPCVSARLKELVERAFDPSELAVVIGGPDVAQEFVSLPFDHLLFTGSTAVGRRVMQAAAEHLVPLTLELGGKCPVIIGRSANLARAVDRIMTAKLANAGQICLAPDYVWAPRERLDEFVTQARHWVQRAYPELPGNDDYTSLISEPHVARIGALLEDAGAKGARIIPLAAGPPGPPHLRLVTPAIILGATKDMRVMQEEIFGPLLPIRSYDRIEEAIDEINLGARPLALYYFGDDRAEQDAVLARTCSGGVTVNDIAMHFLAEELPFGGVGASGMGAYHGEHGFRRFSHERAIFRQGRLDLAGLVGLRPPYGERLRRSLRVLIRR
jgi:coniferyl-aldehyde dehydrogenase